MLWFAAWGNGPNGANCLTKPGEAGPVLSRHGLREAVLKKVLGGGRLSAWEDFSCDLAPGFDLDEGKPSICGFKVGEKRLVVALLLTPEVLAKHPLAHLTLHNLPGRLEVQLVDVLGNATPLACTSAGKDWQVEVDLHKLVPQVARNYGHEFKVAVAYLVVDKSAN